MSSPKGVVADESIAEPVTASNNTDADDRQGSCFTGAIAFLRNIPIFWKVLCCIIAMGVIPILISTVIGDDAYQHLKNEIEYLLNEQNYHNYTTIKDAVHEDYVTLLAATLHKNFEHIHVKAEVELFSMFNNFNRVFDRTHDSIAHKQERFLVYRANCLKILDNNRNPNRSFQMELNGFGDITAEEFMALHTVRFVPRDQGSKDVGPVSQPTATSWRSIDCAEQVQMTPVKNYIATGPSSSVFAATATLESLLKKHNQHVSLSEQQLIDCMPEGEGDIYSAYEFLKTHGVTNGTVYPYKGTKQKCLPVEGQPNYKLINYGYTEKPDLFDLLDKKGPVTVYVAVNEAWQFYSNGVIDTCGKEVNHAVVLAGVTEGPAFSYWLIKNSWGPDWGIGGYARVDYHSKNFDNECGMNLVAMHLEEIALENVQFASRVPPTVKI